MYGNLEQQLKAVNHYMLTLTITSFRPINNPWCEGEDLYTELCNTEVGYTNRNTSILKSDLRRVHIYSIIQNIQNVHS